MIYKTNTRLMIASIPAPDTARFFEAAPVYEEGVAEVPRSLVADGRIGEPVAADPGPGPKLPEEPTKPVGLAFPVAITYPLLATTAVELKANVNEDLRYYSKKFIPNS